MKRSLIIFSIVGITFINCSNTTKQSLQKEEKAETETNTTGKLTNTTTQEDTTIYYLDSRNVHNTPYMANPKKYFRDNNKYKDWDKNDKKHVLISFVSEKDGSTSHVKVKKSCGIEKLDNEALRLIENLKYEEPAIDIKGTPVRAGDMIILVYFPPQ